MKRTTAVSLIITGIIAAAGAWMLQLGLAASGRAVLVPPLTLPLALTAIGAIVVSLAMPIRRMTRGSGPGPVDPFFATRVVMLAKASALSGALITGVGVGWLVHLLTRAVVPAIGSLVPSIAAIVGAAVLLSCGLIAEFMCRIPPRDDEDDDDDEKPIHARA